MRPLSELSSRVAQSVQAVLTDIDDTLTEHGRLPAEVSASLRDLRSDGLVVIPVTGRPAGWCDLIARQWEVDGVVGENGALWFRYDASARRMIKIFAREQSDRAEDRRRLDDILAEVLRCVPGAAPASDQEYRTSDLAIDYCEDVTRLPPEQVDRIVEIFRAHGATAKVSSIHVNGWFGAFDKLTMAMRALREDHHLDADRDRASVIYVGDSPNDAPMFRHFPNSIGVANVRDFANRIECLPRFVTAAPYARGFVEFAQALLRLRSS